MGWSIDWRARQKPRRWRSGRQQWRECCSRRVLLCTFDQNQCRAIGVRQALLKVRLNERRAMETLKVNTRPNAEEFPRGVALLRDPLLNKGTAFSEKERDALGLRGLLPAHLLSQEEQVARILTNLRRPMTLKNTSRSTRCTIAMRHCSSVSFVTISMKFSR
jgi:hypothetical protein